MSSEIEKPATTASGAKAYPEHDKLGPLPAPSRGPALHPTGDLRGSVLAAFRDSLDQARKAAGNAGDDLDDAVHEYRKSLRRARAILALVSDDLPEVDADAILQTLRRARRAVSAARDHAVAPKALAGLALDDGPREAAQQVIAAARAAAPDRDEVTRHLAAGADQVAGTADALAVALPTDLDWPMVLDGVARTYRAARRQLGDAKRSRRAFHAWRRRTKELSYQLALIAAGAGERTQVIAGEVDGLSDELGDVVDLVMLESFIESHATPAVDGDAVRATDDEAAAAPSLDDDALEALTEAAETALRDRGRVARRMGKEVFAKSTRRFARRLGKAVRRDLAPPDIEIIAETDAEDSDPAEAGATVGAAPRVVS
jgi:CHAD domain-containing protein